MGNSIYRDIMFKYADLPLRDVVFQTLKEAILTGKLRPGERLMEIHLADELGVSRTPVRDAIHNLELEGLVVMLPRRGAHVARISEKNVVDVLEVRRALEGLSVDLGCARMTEADHEALKEACRNFEEVTKEGTVQEVAQADVLFHGVILSATGNKKLIAIMQGLSDQLYRYRLEYLKERQYYPSLIEEHRVITEALINREVDVAVAHIKTHIDRQAQAILRSIRDQ